VPSLSLGDVFPKVKEGMSFQPLQTCCECTRNSGKPSASDGRQSGGPGGRSPRGRGHGGCPPQNKMRERVAHISNPATSGTQNAGKPKAYEGGEKSRLPKSRTHSASFAMMAQKRYYMLWKKTPSEGGIWISGKPLREDTA